MPVETLTYAALGERLGCSPEAARALAKRLRRKRWESSRRRRPHRDRAQASTRPVTIRSSLSRGDIASPDRCTQAELAKVEAAAAGHRGDFERERDRADKLLSEVLRTTLDLIAAREATARTEGDLAVVRAQAEGEVAAVRAHIERLETELVTIRARRRWWRRLRT